MAALAPAWAADCILPDGAAAGHVTYVLDGDTVALSDGRRVRLIGIDAPEVGHDGEPDRPFAQAAKQALHRALERSQWRVRLVPGRDRRDRHGRALANLYDRQGRNLSAYLLRLGLAYQITIPPNDRFEGCYAEAEADARRHRRGLWSGPALEAATLPAGTAGFQRVAGRVRDLRFTRHSAWIDLDGELKLRIAAADLHRFGKDRLAALPGTRIEALGWVYHYRGKPRMRLRDPSALLYAVPLTH